jgi:hypothetical protein
MERWSWADDVHERVQEDQKVYAHVFDERQGKQQQQQQQ